MHADKTTINDLAIFSREEENAVFHLFDMAQTIGGREWLKYYIGSPLGSIKEILERQSLIQRIINVLDAWPQKINNGTIMVLQKYFETPVDSVPKKADPVTALFYKIINGPDYSLVKYTVIHFTEFIVGMQLLKDLLQDDKNPPELRTMLERIDALLKRPALQRLLHVGDKEKLSLSEILNEGHFLRYDFKTQCLELIELYSRLDAFYGMAVACKKFSFSFPAFIDTERPYLTANQLYHPLLPVPVSYDISLTHQHNFLFLTGANMAGKSTFIKGVGVAVYLAHVGMGVPAKSMELSYFDGLLSNIHVEDNIIKGESYFYNEVQRIRKTLDKISDGKKWLILIDELFKGTNVQDAMKCSTVVIEGLRKKQNTLFILSTHLYEIGENLKQYPNIQFRFFETQVKDDQLIFSYHLKEGISNDRLGYLILKKEGIVDMLEKL